MTEPFADSSDVEAALLRPLTSAEQNYVDQLLAQASELLRNAAPSIDDRIGRYAIDPSDRTAISPTVVASVVAGAVKRYLSNPRGLASSSESVGPFSRSESYALRSEKETRGLLQITPEDLATLFPNRNRMRAGTIRTRPALAPRPVGRYGPPPNSVGAAVAAEVAFGQHVQPIQFDDPRNQ